MSKNEKIAFNLPDELASIDDELDAAMHRIDEKNLGIDTLLKNLDLTVSAGSANAAEIEDEDSAPDSGAAASGA